MEDIPHLLSTYTCPTFCGLPVGLWYSIHVMAMQIKEISFKSHYSTLDRNLEPGMENLGSNFHQPLTSLLSHKSKINQLSVNCILVNYYEEKRDHEENYVCLRVDRWEIELPYAYLRQKARDIWGTVFIALSFLPIAIYLYSPQQYMAKYLVLVATATSFKIDAKF